MNCFENSSTLIGITGIKNFKEGENETAID